MADWLVDVDEPYDDWVYGMNGNKQRQSRFLVRHNIANPPLCSDCGHFCSARHISNERELKRNKLPFRWRCANPQCTDETFNFLTDSFISNGKLDTFKYIQLLYKFYLKQDAKTAARQLHINHNTVKKFFAFFRECISKYMQDEWYPSFQFDVSDVLEYDEANLARKHKHHRGNRTEPVWVLGGTARQSQYVKFDVVDDRTRPTLHDLILDVAPLGSTVVTDGWRAYMGLSDYGIAHWTVNHARTFVDPWSQQHTNTIEGLWALIRCDLRSLRGIKHNTLQAHLDVFAFRRNLRNTPEGLWSKMCCVIGAMQGRVIV